LANNTKLLRLKRIAGGREGGGGGGMNTKRRRKRELENNYEFKTASAPPRASWFLSYTLTLNSMRFTFSIQYVSGT
jgi:hypothetical protein